jgi:hypothetical protein
MFAQDTGKETQLEIKLSKSIKKSKEQLLKQELLALKIPEN